MRINGNEEFKDGFRNDFTMDEFVKWYKGRNKLSEIQNNCPPLFGTLTIVLLLCAIVLPEFDKFISGIFAVITLCFFSCLYFINLCNK